MITTFILVMVLVSAPDTRQVFADESGLPVIFYSKKDCEDVKQQASMLLDNLRASGVEQYKDGYSIGCVPVQLANKRGDGA